MTLAEAKSKFCNPAFIEFLEKEFDLERKGANTDPISNYVINIQVLYLWKAFNAGRRYASTPPVLLTETKPFSGDV